MAQLVQWGLGRVGLGRGMNEAMKAGVAPWHEETEQRNLIAFLQQERCYPHRAAHVRLIETHASWVLLAGRYAYKIKKALNLGFLDYRSLAARKFYCEEELRLNRRTAPHIYLDVIAIGGSPDQPVIGSTPAIEYAVKMRRFSVEAEMDRMIIAGRVKASHVDSLASVLGNFHMKLAPLSLEQPYGHTAAIWEQARLNFTQLPSGLLDARGRFAVQAMCDAMKDEYTQVAALIEQRRLQGYVRECHGDLHLGNIVIQRERAVPFDGIEFDPALRWTDIVCDVAFPFMDLQYFEHPAWAYRLLNGWLEITGDYGGLALLPFYAAYRAAVRAKVNAIRAAQTHVTADLRQLAQQDFRRYLSLSCDCLVRPGAALIITHGLPGSGKTTFAQKALERYGAIRIRSDVERKRLFGLTALASSQQAVPDIYSAPATARTYAVLAKIARGLLMQGFRVIVDAAFLQPAERKQFRQLALEMSVPFVVASIVAEDTVMRARVEARMQQRQDASEADINVLQALQASNQPLTQREQPDVITFVNDGAEGFSDNAPGWQLLAQRLG